MTEAHSRYHSKIEFQAIDVGANTATGELFLAIIAGMVKFERSCLKRSGKTMNRSSLIAYL
jgi:hypothetical protein